MIIIASARYSALVEAHSPSMAFVLHILGTLPLLCRNMLTSPYLRGVELVLNLILELSVVVTEVLVGLSSVVGHVDRHEKTISFVVLHHHLGIVAPPVTWMKLLIRYSHLLKLIINSYLVGTIRYCEKGCGNALQWTPGKSA